MPTIDNGLDPVKIAILRETDLQCRVSMKQLARLNVGRDVVDSLVQDGLMIAGGAGAKATWVLSTAGKAAIG